MLVEIESTLIAKEKSGELDRLKKEAIKRTKNSIENPAPVLGLLKVDKARTLYYDPSYTLPETVRTPDGKIIAQAGTVVNPLDYVNLSKHMLFFDGTDPFQAKKALELHKHYKGMIKLVLVSGPVADLTRKWKFQVYFDQGGVIVKKLGIKRVPSLVSQEGKKLRIDEMETK